jgi:MFS family permease
MLLAGQSLSNIGNYVHTIAFPWLVLGPHEDVAMLGTLVAASGIATMAGIPLGGYLADRLGSWRVMLWSDCSQIVFATTLALMAYLLAPSLAWLLPLDVCAGFCGGLFIPSSMSVIPALLPEEQIGRGVTIYSGGLQLVGVIGPALGGVTVALAGAPCALAIDAGSYLASTLTLLGVRKFMTAAALSASDEPEVTTEQTRAPICRVGMLGGPVSEPLPSWHRALRVNPRARTATGLRMSLPMPLAPREFPARLPPLRPSPRLDRHHVRSVGGERSR